MYKTKKTTYLKTITLSLIILFTYLHGNCQATLVSRQESLEKYTGYYDVGVKPGKPFFKARIYIRSNSLFVIFDGDIDHELVQKEDKANNFYLKTDTLFHNPIEFYESNEDISGFKLVRPRNLWATDLYGQKNKALSKYGVDTEVELVNKLNSQHFSIYYGREQPKDIDNIKNVLEKNYRELLRSFRIDSMPIVTIRIYPDLKTYHNSVLTPEAPEWQAGKSWSKDEIRMVSNLDVKQDFSIEEGILHEFIHCLNWQLDGKYVKTPGWLWEGVAMFKGCCKQRLPSELTYLKEKKYPSLEKIERDLTGQLKYDLGYYLVEFITKEYGWEKTLSLIQTNGNINASLAISPKEFDKRFYSYLEENYLK